LRAFRLPRWLLRRAINWWPPFLGAGVRVRRFAPDYREVEVDMPLRWYNRNVFGSHFGGSLYALTDPFFVLMIAHNLPRDYLVWDKSASIDYVAPARSRVRATLRLSDADLETITRMTAGGDKHLHLFKVEVRDADDLVVARVEKIVYVRRRRTGIGQMHDAA
jgi:acyl-coenzyme A thioesterase PaaI-like protein